MSEDDSRTAKPGKRATINDVARVAEVSKKTVSRVINQSPFVREDTRERVQAAIDELGFIPDPQARGLAFHPNHFQCATCSKELGGRAYMEKDEKFYCEEDYYAVGCFSEPAMGAR